MIFPPQAVKQAENRVHVASNSYLHTNKKDKKWQQMRLESHIVTGFK